jgi:hypothetical protein
MSRCHICDFSSDTGTVFGSNFSHHSRRVLYSPLHEEYICTDCSSAIDEINLPFKQEDELYDDQQWSGEKHNKELFAPTAKELRFNGRQQGRSRQDPPTLSLRKVK